MGGFRNKPERSLSILAVNKPRRTRAEPFGARKAEGGKSESGGADVAAASGDGGGEK